MGELHSGGKKTIPGGPPLQGDHSRSLCHSKGELLAELPLEGGSQGFIFAEPGEAQRNSIQFGLFVGSEVCIGTGAAQLPVQASCGGGAY